MKATSKLLLSALLVIMIFLTACNRNYYSGNGKFKTSNCGCPGQKG